MVIYVVEEHLDFAPKIEVYFSTAPDVELFVSDLTVLECLVVPLRNKNASLIEKFRGWFANIKVRSLPKEVFDKAARLRADHSSLKTPDALHLATALYYNCNEFWTNDNRLETAASDFAKNIFAIRD